MLTPANSTRAVVRGGGGGGGDVDDPPPPPPPPPPGPDQICYNHNSTILVPPLRTRTKFTTVQSREKWPCKRVESGNVHRHNRQVRPPQTFFLATALSTRLKRSLNKPMHDNQCMPQPDFTLVLAAKRACTHQ